MLTNKTNRDRALQPVLFYITRYTTTKTPLLIANREYNQLTSAIVEKHTQRHHLKEVLDFYENDFVCVTGNASYVCEIKKQWIRPSLEYILKVDFTCPPLSIADLVPKMVVSSTLEKMKVAHSNVFERTDDKALKEYCEKDNPCWIFINIQFMDFIRKVSLFSCEFFFVLQTPTGQIIYNRQTKQTQTRDINKFKTKEEQRNDVDLDSDCPSIKDNVLDVEFGYVC